MSSLQGLFSESVAVIGVGLETFSDDLRSQNVSVVHRAWSAPTEQEKKDRELADKVAALLER